MTQEEAVARVQAFGLELARLISELERTRWERDMARRGAQLWKGTAKRLLAQTRWFGFVGGLLNREEP